MVSPAQPVPVTPETLRASIKPQLLSGESLSLESISGDPGESSSLQVLHPWVGPAPKSCPRTLSVLTLSFSSLHQPLSEVFPLPVQDEQFSNTLEQLGGLCTSCCSPAPWDGVCRQGGGYRTRIWAALELFHPPHCCLSLPCHPLVSQARAIPCKHMEIPDSYIFCAFGSLTIIWDNGLMKRISACPSM